MIKVLLQGGLGNQMFQYAFARALAHRGFDIALDASWSYIKRPNIRTIINKTKLTAPATSYEQIGGGDILITL